MSNTTRLLRKNDHTLDRLRGLVAQDNAPLGLLIDTRYEVQRRIAQGGMGDVFFAVDRRLDRPVAMKILSRQISHPAWRERFEAEARTLGRLEHPGIVPIFDMGSLPDGRLYYTMRYISGHTLEGMMGSEGVHDRLIKLLCDTCDIVQHAHERGVIHRDLKPANIMIGERGRVFVLDWGIARMIEQLALSIQPGTGKGEGDGVILGTVEYMPPEQAMGMSEAISERSDVYSLGAILYEILTGRPPVVGGSATEIIQKAAYPEIRPPRDLNPGIPADLEAICLKALNFDSHLRYPSAGALAHDLRDFLAGRSVSARATGHVAHAIRSARRHPVAAVLLVLLLGGAVAAPFAVNEIRRVARERSAEEQALKLLESVQESISQMDRLLYSKDMDSADLGRRCDLSLSRVQEAVNLAPRLPLAHYLRGRIDAIRGADDDAERAWREAIALDPDFGAAHQALGRLLLMRAMLLNVQNFRNMSPPRAGAVESLVQDGLKEMESAFRLGMAGTEQETSRRLAVVQVDLARGRVRRALRKIRWHLHRHPREYGSEEFYFLEALCHPGSFSRRALTQALALRPRFGLALWLRGISRAEEGDDAGAIADFTMAAESLPRFRPVHTLRGISMLDVGRYTEALADFETALRMEPDRPEAYAHRSSALLPLGRKNEALEDSERALDMDARCVPAWVSLARVRHALGDDEAAIHACRSLIDLDPPLREGHVLLGEVLLEQGLYEEALAALLQGLERRPEDGYLLAKLADACNGLRQWKRAEEFATRALQQDPMRAEAYGFRGVARLELGDLPASQEDLQRALSLKDTIQNRYNVALYREKVGDDEGAFQICEEIIKRGESFAPAYSMRGLIHRRRGALDLALHDFTKTVELAPDNWNGYINRANVYMEQGEVARSAAECDQMIQLGCREIEAYCIRGAARMHLGRLSEAIEDLEHARSIAPPGWEATKAGRYVVEQALPYLYRKSPQY